MQTPLFLDPTIKLEKVASTTHLEDEPEKWPVEILKHAYAQLPSLRSYEADIELDRVDGARGYAVGKLVLFPLQMTKEAAAGDDKLVVVPVVVRDRELAPLDVYSHKGKMWPLDEEEIQQLLFRAETFDRLAGRDQFQGSDMSNQLSPPVMDHQSSGGSGMWKGAQEGFSTEAVEGFQRRMREDAGLRLAYLSTSALRPYCADLMRFDKTAAAKVQEAPLKPSVIQFSEDGQGYMVKSANYRCVKSTSQKVSRHEVQKLLSKKAFEKLAKESTLTLSTEPLDQEMVEKVAQEADRFGVYRVWGGGRAHEGFVVPKLVTLDGLDTELQLFSGQNGHAMQEKVAGIFERDITVLPGRPQGKGVFLYQEGPMAMAYEPVEILNGVTKGQGEEKVASYVGRRLATGEPVTFTVVPGLRQLTKVASGEYGIPETLRFLPIHGKQIEVAGSPGLAHLFEHQKVAGTQGVILHKQEDGDFWFEGPNADLLRGQYGNQDWAEFNLCLLGTTGHQARELTKVASRHGMVRISRTRLIVDEESIQGQMTKHASAVIQGVEKLPRVDLFKEAALLTNKKAQELWKQASVVLSKETLDAILSLNFVTPENASVYVSYLPELEKAAGMLAELLIASRLGMDDVRESAAKNAMTQVHAVIQGLENIREKIQ